MKRSRRAYSIPPDRAPKRAPIGFGGVRKNRGLIGGWKQSKLDCPGGPAKGVVDEDEHREIARKAACSGAYRAVPDGDHQCPDCGRWLTAQGGVIPWHLPRHPVTRAVVQEARKRVVFACVMSAAFDALMAEERDPGAPPLGPPTRVRHLWWPKDNAHAYCLREGNPPADVDRPLWLRGHRLEIDIGDIPSPVWQAAREWTAKMRLKSSKPPLTIPTAPSALRERLD